MSLHSSLRTIHDLMVPVVPAQAMLWMEERYLRLCGEHEIHLLDVLCKRDRDALDIGGHEGCFSTFMRRYAREVLAFEPVPDMADELARKFGDSVDVRCVALSSSNGRAVLHIPEINGELVTALSSLAKTPATRHLTMHGIIVDTGRLDDVYSGDVGFIKIDVEGHEEAVLDGAEATIAFNRPRMLIEIEERHAPGALFRIVRRLALQHYRCHFLNKGLVQPIQRFDLATMQDQESQSRYGCYINNFIFLPEEEADDLVEEMNSRPPHVQLKLRRRVLPAHV